MGKPLKEQIAALEPGSKAAKVRAVMPDIERQIANGVPHKDIVAALNTSGLEITQKNFELILYRYRKKWGKPDQPVIEKTPTRPEQTASESKPEQESPEETENETNLSDQEAFERSLDPVERDKYADQFMGRRRPFGAKKRSS